MPAAVLTDWQEQVLAAVKNTAPHAKLERLAATLDRSPMYVRMALDALTRRGFVTPIEVWPDGEVYIATHKGRAR